MLILISWHGWSRENVLNFGGVLSFSGSYSPTKPHPICAYANVRVQNIAAWSTVLMYKQNTCAVDILNISFQTYVLHVFECGKLLRFIQYFFFFFLTLLVRYNFSPFFRNNTPRRLWGCIHMFTLHNSVEEGSRANVLRAETKRESTSATTNWHAYTIPIPLVIGFE